MLDRAQPVRRDTQLDAGFQRFGHQRHVLQIGQKGTLGLVVGVGHVVAHLTALAGQFANARHRLKSCVLGFPERTGRSEEHTSELQSLMRISYAVFCLKKKSTSDKSTTQVSNKPAHTRSYYTT